MPENKDNVSPLNIILFIDVGRLLQCKKLPGLDLLYVDDYEEPDDW